MSDILLLSLIIFAPTIGAFLLAWFDKKAEEPMRIFALGVTIVTFFLTLQLYGQFDADAGFLRQGGEEAGQLIVTAEWIPQWNINYTLGVDGISMPLVLLTSFTSLLAMAASWSIKKQVKGYLILFLLLETGMLGVFLMNALLAAVLADLRST